MFKLLLGTLCISLLVTSPVEGQRGRRERGERTANWDQIESANPSGPRITRNDVEKFSAIRIVVDKRKELKLTDQQVKQLREQIPLEETALDDRLARFDSLRMAVRRRAGADEDEERARTSLARQELMASIAAIRAGYDSTFTAALELLADDQRASARTVVEKERAEREEDLRERMNGGAGMRGGEGGGARRP